MPDLDRIHHVALTEGEISTILYILEGYAQGNDDDELLKDMDNIFNKLEGSVDTFYDKLEQARQESKGQQAFEEYLEQRNGMQTFIPNFHD